jgi:hypothetical protein
LAGFFISILVGPSLQLAKFNFVCFFTSKLGWTEWEGEKDFHPIPISFLGLGEDFLKWQWLPPNQAHRMENKSG